MNKIRVLVVDDHPIVRQGLIQLLGEYRDLEVVGEAGDGQEALDKVRSGSVDVVLLDIAMPKMNGFEAVRLIRESSPHTRIAVFSMYEKEEYVHKFLDAGALGYLLKGSSGVEIVAAVRRVNRGEYFLSSKIKAGVIDQYVRCRREQLPTEPYDLLSEREQQVFRLLVEGHPTHAIAKTLCVSPKTVEKHRVNIIRKLDCPDIVSMIKYAIRIGVIDPDFWKN